MVMPREAQALKWFEVVTVPLVRWLARTDQNWLKVAVPWMEGSLVRTLVKMLYVEPSEVREPLCVPPLEGSYVPKSSTM